MIFFGHIGITMAAVKTYENIFLKNNSIHKDIDYRIVILGSLIPDIIDKPLGDFLFRDYFQNGRIFGHTLIFSLMLLFISIFFKFNKTILILGISALIHQLLDQMWLYPIMFFWPLLGLKFPKLPISQWLTGGFVDLILQPHIFIPELLGASIMGYFSYKIIINKKIDEFIMKGKLH